MRVAASPARRLPRSPPPAPGSGGGRHRGPWRLLPGPGGCCCCCCRRGRCRGIDPSAQPSRGFGARAPAGAEQAAARAAGPARHPKLSPYLGLGRGLRTRQPPQRTWGGEAGRGPGKEGCWPEFPLLTFNMGLRCLGMQRDRRSAAAAGVLSAEGKQKALGSSPRTPGLQHPLWARTPPAPTPGSCWVSLRQRPRRWEGQREE